MKIIFFIITGILISTFYPFNVTKAAESSIVELYQAENFINTDSSINTLENFTVNFFNDSSGYYRSVYTEVKDREGEVVKQPVRILNIKDSNDKPLHYSTVMDNKSHAINWRVWDLRQTLSGTYNYKINYTIKNIVYTKLQDFDYLHINIAGASQTETKKVRVRLIFPEEIDIGKFNQNSLDLKDMNTNKYIKDVPFKYDKNIAYFDYDNLHAGQRLVYYAEIPKGTFIPYHLRFWEQYDYLYYNVKIFLWALPTFAIIIFCLVLWFIFGRDPKRKRTIVAEYSAPPDLKPIEIGLLLNDINLRKRYVAATILDLINRKFIKSEDVFDDKGNLIDHKMILLREQYNKLDLAEKNIIDSVFLNYKEVRLSQLKDARCNWKIIEKLSFISLRAKGLVEPIGYNIKQYLLYIGFTFTVFLIYVIYNIELVPFYFHNEIFNIMSSMIIYNCIGLLIVLSLFAYIMPRLTKKGMKTVEQLKGFRLYIEKVEKYPQQYQEKNIITNKILPYTTLFGYTKVFAKKLDNNLL